MHDGDKLFGDLWDKLCADLGAGERTPRGVADWLCAPAAPGTNRPSYLAGLGLQQDADVVFNVFNARLDGSVDRNDSTEGWMECWDDGSRESFIKFMRARFVLDELQLSPNRPRRPVPEPESGSEPPPPPAPPPCV